MGYRLSIDGYHGGGKIISRKKFIAGIIVTILAVILSFIVGYLVRHARKCPEVHGKPYHFKSNDELKGFYIEVADTMKAENLRENLRYFAKKPHVASSNRTREIVDNIYSRFKSYGFIPEYHEYETLLSFPDLKKPNSVKVFAENGTQIFETRKMEKIYEPSENDPMSLPPYLAYGKSGDVKGDIVYANYGRQEDYQYLVDNGINLNGTIAIVRYGKIGRGEKVANGYEKGVLGVMIYGDPKNYAPSTKFPEGRWLPDDGVQRGSILGYGNDIVEGDPLTNGYPAKDWAYKPEISEAKGLPPIPAQPIAASDAEILLSMMQGADVPEDWEGAFDIDYKTGPLKNSSKVELKVNNKLEMKKIRNVCGTIKGQVEPDRYVLLGNHLDAWVFGAVDASSGTTVMMEIARALGDQVKQGWKPRRSIKLCGWNGEEFNLIGSVEYVEEFFSQLRDQAVAYINIDSAVAGNYSLQTAASPLLHEMMFEVHQSVEDPYIENMSVFDKNKLAYEDKTYPDKHKIYLLGAGSDYFAFYKFLGIPSIDMGYRQKDLDKKYNTSYYPMYHTLHDTVYWMENFVDKDYKIHLTVAKAGIQYLLHLSDLPLIPYNGIRYAEGLNRSISKFNEIFKGTKVEGKELAEFFASMKRFHTKMNQLNDCMQKLDLKNTLQLRMFNDKMMQLEKKLTFPLGVPGKPQLKHYVMVSSRSWKTEYPFAPISNLLPKINETGIWKEIRRQISITTSLIESVARVPCSESSLQL